MGKRCRLMRVSFSSVARILAMSGARLAVIALSRRAGGGIRLWDSLNMATDFFFQQIIVQELCHNWIAAFVLRRSNTFSLVTKFYPVNLRRRETSRIEAGADFARERILQMTWL